MLEVGQKIDNFTLLNQDGDKISLDSFRGKNIVLYFYPKDNTAGCTKQACLYRDRQAIFNQNNIVVLGISKDSVKSHLNFRLKHDLNFNILSDENLDVIKYFDVWKEKSMYGKKYFGVNRTTFLINEDGILLEIISKPKVATDADDVLKYFNINYDIPN